jgi:hypothetical protein
MAANSVQVFASMNATADVDAAVAANDRLVLMGVVVAETAATPGVAEVVIINGADGDGAPVVPVFCAASATHGFWFDSGLHCPAGITIERISGETSVTVYYRLV